MTETSKTCVASLPAPDGVKALIGLTEDYRNPGGQDADLFVYFEITDPGFRRRTHAGPPGLFQRESR